MLKREEKVEMTFKDQEAKDLAAGKQRTVVAELERAREENLAKAPYESPDEVKIREAKKVLADINAGELDDPRSKGFVRDEDKKKHTVENPKVVVGKREVEAKKSVFNG